MSMIDAVASCIMRTTLNIDDDVLQAVKELGRRSRRSAGRVLSELARQSLTRDPTASRDREEREIFGFRPLRAIPGRLVTNEMIDRLREEELE